MSHLHCLAENLFCKIVPADVAALVGGMIVTVFICLQHVHQKSCQIKCIRRRTDLVIHHSQCVVGLTHVQHGLDEILSVLTEHPGNADNEVLLQCLRHSQLSCQLCLSVHVQRFVVLAVRIPGSLTLSVKHVVRT